MEGTTILRKLLLWSNSFMAVALGFSVLSPYVNPNLFIGMAFFGLAFLPLLVLNLIMVLFWFFVKPKYALVSAVFLCPAVFGLDKHIGLISAGSKEGISVLSYNVRLFDLYNWTQNKSTRNEIIKYVKETNADIMCFQEYFNSNDPNYFATLDLLTEELGNVAYQEEFSAVLHKGRHQFGIATLSRHPIVRRGRIPLDKSLHNIAIYTDIAVGVDTLRVFNFHLASVHLSRIEQRIEQHLETNERQKQWEDAKEMLALLAGGYRRRADQVQVIRDHIRQSPYPVLACGDLNDTPGSYAYRVISDGLEDAFSKHGKGFGSTYIGFFPSMRIDYILHDDRLEATHFVTDNIRLSDHRPLLARFKFAHDD